MTFKSLDRANAGGVGCGVSQITGQIFSIIYVFKFKIITFMIKLTLLDTIIH